MPNEKKSKSKVNGWLVVGVIVLIVLLFGWLTFADMAGDTDVSSSTNFATDNPEAQINQPTDPGQPAQPAAETAQTVETVEVVD